MSLTNNYQFDKIINNDDSVETKTDLINALVDDDCLSIILSYFQPFDLVETSKVCQRWNYQSQLAWIHIRKFECTTPIFGYKNNWKLVNFYKLENVFSRGGRYLTHLTLKNVCGSEIVPLIRDHCQDLVRLELVLNKVDDIDFDNAFTKMNKLNYISINIHPKFHLLNDELYGAIVSTLHSAISEIHLPSICDSDTYNYASFESMYFFYWMEKFDNLQALTLHYQIMNDNDILTILNHKKLLHLSLKNGVIENYLLRKLSNLIHLEYLDLSYVYDVDDRVVSNIANNCCKLKYLNLKKCSLVTGNSISKLARLIDLEHLIIEKLNLNENCISNIARNCKNLKTLNISESENVQKLDIMSIVEFKFLQHLELGNLESLDDDGLINIINKCCHLKYLNIKACNNVTKNSIDEIKKLKKLETLIVSDINNIDDEFISHLYNLKCLNCNGCEVTDISIKNVIKNCPSIEKLCVAGTKITVDSLIFAAQETNKRSENIILTIEADDVIDNEYEKISQIGLNVLFRTKTS